MTPTTDKTSLTPNDDYLVSNGCGAVGSSGSMNNPMYRHIHTGGTFEPQSGRNKRRFHARKNYGVCLSKKKKFWELGNLEEGN